MLARQTTAEANLYAEQNKSQPAECTPPPVCHDFQTARLFLSHFGLLNLEDDEDKASSPTLIALDSSAADFSKDLNILDSMSSRTCDTVHIFYIRSQQTNAEDIVRNVTDENNLSPYFLKFIYSLGWPVNVHQHPGK